MVLYRHAAHLCILKNEITTLSESSSMKKTSPEESMLQYPVFQVTGGTADDRLACIDSIENAFRLAHLNIGVVKCGKSSRYELALLSQRYDLVLLDGDVDCVLNRIDLRRGDERQGNCLNFLGEKNHDIDIFCDLLLEKLVSLTLMTPVWACILIGGKSSRMGQPKHLLKAIEEKKESWIERTVGELQPLVDGLVISGKGELPDTLMDVQRIPDIPGVVGPLTGVVSAMRWQPRVSWLVIACDMPFVSRQAVEWLFAKRYPGCWGRLPRLADTDFCEPLFAWYDGRAAQLLEEQLLTGNLRAGAVASHHKIDNPVIPDDLAFAWQNVNTPEQLQKVQHS